jgi:hypothetical protein
MAIARVSVLCRLLCVLLFVAWTEESRSLMYEGHWKSPLQVLNPIMTTLPAVHLSSWQLLLLVLSPACLLLRGGLRRRSWVMDAAVLVSVASVTVTFLWGMARGGSAFDAYFQLGSFLTALLFGVLLQSVVRSPSDLRALGVTILLGALTRGSLVIYFYFVHVQGKIDPAPSYMTCHEDSLLFVLALLVVLTWALARRRWTAWVSCGLVFAYLLWAMALNARRLVWLELLFVMVFVYALLPSGVLRRRVNLTLLIAGPLLLAYAVVGWGRSEPFFEPLRAFSSSGSNEDASSLARLEEIRNLMYTLSESHNPLLGTGWGQPYQKVTSYYANLGSSWEQYLYMPHNSLLAVAVFGGFVGLFGVWLVVPVAAFLGTRAYLAATHPAARAACMTAVCILPAFGAQCYGDVGLQQRSCTLILGIAIGVAGRLSYECEAAARKLRAARPSPDRAVDGPPTPDTFGEPVDVPPHDPRGVMR